MNDDTDVTRKQLDSWVDNADGAIAVARVATYKLALLTRDLEPQIYGKDEFLEEIRRIATSGRYAQVRVLVQDSRRAVSEGHKLIELSRRLTTFIEVRNPHPEHKHVNESYLIADERGLLYRTESARYEGFADTDAPMEARQRLREFDAMWDRAVADPEFRRLGV